MFACLMVQRPSFSFSHVQAKSVNFADFAWGHTMEDEKLNGVMEVQTVQRSLFDGIFKGYMIETVNKEIREQNDTKYQYQHSKMNNYAVSGDISTGILLPC